MIVRELLTRLGFRIDAGNLIIYNQTINNIHNAADRASNALSGLFGLLAAGGALGGITKIADEMQNLEARIKLLPQTVGDIGDAFNEVSKHADAARQPIKEYAKLYVRIGHAAKTYLKTQDDVLGITDTIAKGLIVGGASAQESSSVMTQLSQALGSGVLQGQEFNSMAEGAPQLLDALAVAMGKPRDQLKKLASEGKVTTKDLILGFQKIKDDVEKQFLSMPMNIGQALTLIKNRFSTFIARLNRESGGVTKIANFFVNTFKKIEVGLDNMVEFFGGATNTLKFFGIALAAVFTPIAAKAMAALVGLVLSPIGLLVISLTALGLIWEDFNTWLEGGNSLLGDFFDQINEGNGPVGDAVNSIKAFKLYIEDAFKSGALAFFVSKLVEMKNGIVAAFGETGVITKFIGLLRKVFEFFYDITPFNEIFNNIARVFYGLVNVFFGIVDIISGAFKILVGLLSGDFEMMYEGLGQLVSGFLDLVLGVGEVVIGIFKNILIAIGIAFKTAFALVYDVIITSIGNAFKAAADYGMAYLRSKLGEGVDIAVDAAVGLATSMVPSPIKNMLGIGADPITSAYNKYKMPQSIISGITPQTVSAAAASPSGVAGPASMAARPVSVNVYQTLPPGSTSEVAQAAKQATTVAAEFSFNPLARQMGQLQ